MSTTFNSMANYRILRSDEKLFNKLTGLPRLISIIGTHPVTVQFQFSLASKTSIAKFTGLRQSGLGFFQPWGCEERRHLSWQVKITPFILRVTKLHIKYCQNLVSSTALQKIQVLPESVLCLQQADSCKSVIL